MKLLLNTIERFGPMKQTYLLAVLLGLCAAGAAAIELNTDAMKKMQQEGHKILEEGQRSFKLPNGQCLQASGGKLASGKCNKKAGNQKWRFDDKGRLVSQDGTCVSVAGGDKKPGAQAILQKCSGAKPQKWKVDGAKRLVNGLGTCLQAEGGAVVTAKCSKSANQKWG